MSNVKIILNMIVENESSIIERCLDAVKWVDGYFISDTGSVDDTINKIESWGIKNKKIGKVVNNVWKNFGHNRTEAIVQAKTWLSNHGHDLKNVYLLFLDADMLFDNGSCLRNVIETADVWDIRQQNPSIIYSNLRAVRASVDIVCKCPTHEYYEVSTPNIVRMLFENACINDIGDGGSKDDKADRDIRMLKEALTTDPQNCRYWFYLANTYRDMGDYGNAILAYNSRISIPGWYEETYCAYVYKGDCHHILQQTSMAIEAWLNAYQVDPIRGEALIRLAVYFRTISQHHTALLFIDKGLNTPIPMNRQLFLEKPVYEYKFLYELSICAYYVGQLERGKTACLVLLQIQNLPESIIESVKNNLQFYMNKIVP